MRDLRRLPALAALFTGLNLAWELAQLPLYGIWWTESAAQIAYAVVHCTAGDLLIGVGTLIGAVLIAGRGWPADAASRRRVIALTTVFGVGYTVFSEWLNVVIRGAWAYTEWMPILPPLGTGLTPVLQWVLLPGFALYVTYGRPMMPPPLFSTQTRPIGPTRAACGGSRQSVRRQSG